MPKKLSEEYRDALDNYKMLILKSIKETHQ